MTSKNEAIEFNFYHWLFFGTGGRCGISRFGDLWLFVEIAVGIVISVYSPKTLESSANVVLLPLAGILAGLCFAWGGNAHMLLSTEEMTTVTEKHPGGLADFLYQYALAILVLIVTLTLWGLAGLGFFDECWPTIDNYLCYKVVGVILFTLSAMALRECWHTVKGALWTLLIIKNIRRGG